MPLAAVWRYLGLSGYDKVQTLAPGGGEVKILSPFRADKNPSFSVWITSKGQGFCKDHGEGEKAFDEVGIIERAKGLNLKEAIAFYHEMAGVPWGKDGAAGGAVKKRGKVRYSKKTAKKTASSEQAADVNNQSSLGGKLVPFEVNETPTDSSAESSAKKPVKKRKAPLGIPVAEYSYYDSAGDLAHQTLRFEPKQFRQRRPAKVGEDGADGKDWVWSLKDAEVFPYRLPEILKMDKKEPLFLVEGEKDVESLEVWGISATTLPMGAGKWQDSYGQWFNGRWVVIIPDFDKVGKDGKRVGEQGARLIASKLLDSEGNVGILELSEIWPEATEGSDISDFLKSDFCCENAEYVKSHLIKLAELAGVPSDLAYDGCLVGDDKTVAVFEDRLAKRIVKVGGFMYCGSEFWQWRKVDGLWVKLDGKLYLEKMARDAMKAANAEKKITHGKVKSIVGLAESENFCVPEDLNQHPLGYLPVANGVLDVETGDLHSHRPQYKTTVQCPHEYIPEAQCPNWKNWLAERQPDEATQMQVQEMFGYCLFLDINYHSFFFLYGDGGTGKSTCVKVLEHLVGERNIKSMELEDLDNPFTRNGLVGKSLYLCKELTASSFKHIGLIKAIVSGDRISADVKYGRGFDFIPKGRLVMESNVIAATPDSSSGFSRRFIQISWEKPIEVIDYGLEEKLMKEAAGILNWAIEGYKRLKERGRFEHTDRSAEATRQLLLHRAQVPSFANSAALTDHGSDLSYKGRAPVHDVFEAYKDWCVQHDVVAFYKDQTSFMRELMTRKPAWKARKKQFRDDFGERTYGIMGLEVNKDFEL